jgi:lactoylglutathione lyase
MKIACLIALLSIGISVAAQKTNSKVHINHTAIYVMNIPIAGNFYTNIIGLDTIAEPFHDGKHIWYKTGEHTMLHVIQGADQKKEYYKNQHTCFTVTDFNAFTNKLLKINWSFEDVAGNKNKITTRVDGVHQIWLQDPDGYWLEINDDNF